MIPANKLLAQSLEALKKVPGAEECVIKSSDMPRGHRERLEGAGFLKEIMRGWYFVTQPKDEGAIQAFWTGKYWNFIGRYLRDAGEGACLSSEWSLRLLTGETTIPEHMVVLSRTGGTRTVTLKLPTNTAPEGNSFLIYKDAKNIPDNIRDWSGVPIMGIEDAIVRAPVNLFRSSPTTMEIALSLVKDPSALIRTLDKAGSARSAGRLVGAYRHIGNPEFGDKITKYFKALGYIIPVSDPFDRPPTLSGGRISSAYAARLESLWSRHRSTIEEVFAPITNKVRHFETWESVSAKILDRFIEDAYNSLSIEGFSVSPELIGNVRDGKWNPDASVEDKKLEAALAAKGYREAFNAVLATTKTLYEKSPARIAETLWKEHQTWHQALFSPSVSAGILQQDKLLGYRIHPVYLRTSAHVPPRHEVVPELMEKVFDLMKQEPNPAVQAVMGHFLFGHVHPYIDGNGRLARFLMNSVFVSSGYPWTVVHQTNRTQYLSALEAASVDREDGVAIFAEFLAQEMISPPL
ncbi:MAG: Fic family protein [Leptospirales bacterium]